MPDQRTLYVRGVPDRLLREAKALAARRGITLTALVIESLEEAIRAPDDPADPPGALAREIEWYRREKSRLLRRYRGQYLAIVGEEVVDHDLDFSALAGRVFQQHGRRPVLMPRCVPGERKVRLPGPRRRSR